MKPSFSDTFNKRLSDVTIITVPSMYYLKISDIMIKFDRHAKRRMKWRRISEEILVISVVDK